MTAAPSLAQNVHQLIRVHLTHDPTGRVTQQHALIDQLNDAVHSSTRSRSGGKNERGLPINTDAIDLQHRLTQKAKSVEKERTGDTTGGLRVTLYKWALEDRPPWTEHLAGITDHMINEITRLLDPEPPRRPLRQPCPACNQEWATNDEGERKAALTARVYTPEGGMLPTNEWDITCALCNAEWRAADPTFKYVLNALNPNPENSMI